MVVLLALAVAAVFCSLYLLHRKVNHIMAKELDLEQDLTDIGSAISVLADEIKALKDSGAQLVTQEQLDALHVRAQAIKDAATAAV